MNIFGNMSTSTPHKIVSSRNSLELCWGVGFTYTTDDHKKLSYEEGLVKICLLIQFGKKVCECTVHPRGGNCNPSITVEYLSLPRSPEELTTAHFVFAKDCSDLSNLSAIGLMPTEIGSTKNAGCMVCLNYPVDYDNYNIHFYLILEAPGFFIVCDKVPFENRLISQFSELFDHPDGSDVVIVCGNGGHEIKVNKHVSLSLPPLSRNHALVL